MYLKKFEPKYSFVKTFCQKIILLNEKIIQIRKFVIAYVLEHDASLGIKIPIWPPLEGRGRREILAYFH